MLVDRDVTSMPTIDHSITPQFKKRKVGINVRIAPLKFQVEDASICKCCVCFLKDHWRTPMRLHGIFSYFPPTNASIETLNKSDRELFLTPNGN